MDILDEDARLSPLANLRDLGGLRVRGGTVRRDLLWRSDDISLAPPPEVRRLRECGLTTVLDFRSPTERDRVENSGVVAEGLERHDLPFFDMPADAESMMAHWSEVTTARALGLRYVAMMQEAAPVVVEGLAIVAAASGVTLFHCTAGKDRTGVFAAAILGCLGAEREVIVSDYSRTGEAMPAVLTRMARGFGSEISAIEQFVDRDSPLLSAPPEAMDVMLDELDRVCGGADALLRRHGLTDELVESLAAKLVE